MKYSLIIGLISFLISLLTINSKNENVSALGALLIPVALVSAFVFLILVIKNSPKQKNITQFVFQHISGLNYVNPDEFLNLNVEDRITITQGKQREKILAEIEYNNIANVLLLQKIENNEENKSVVGRALVGGLLLGPVGAVVGGMSGIGTRNNQKVLQYLQIKTNDEKEIILKPAFNSSNIANLAKDRIVEMMKI